VFNNKSTAPISQTQKSSAASTIDAAWAGVQTQSVSVQDAALISKMSKLPAFQQGGITADGSVWARFTDGTPIVFVTNDPEAVAKASFKSASYSQAAAKSLSSNLSRHAKPRDPGDLLITNNKAYVIDTSEPALGSPGAAIGTEIGQFGYAVSTLKGSLADWATVSDAGVLIALTRGDIFNNKYYLVSSDVETPALDTQYASMLKSGQLLISHIRVADTVTTGHMESRYSLDSDYLESLPNAKTMFSQVSLFINGSGSGTSSPGLAMASTLESSSGLSAYGGWNAPVLSYDTFETLEFFFDRALGLDLVAPIDPSNPPPQLFSEVYSMMGSAQRQDGTNSTMSTGAPQLNPRTGATVAPAWSWSFGSGFTRATMVPSVDTLEENDVAGTLTIDGNFGPNQGAVLISGNYLTIKSWTPDQIVTNVPSSAGKLRVYGPTSVTGYIKSNQVSFTPLTVDITPTTAVDFGAQQVFTAKVTGTLPSSGVTYQWTLTGDGSLAGGSPVVTTKPMVTYTAPKVAGSATLAVNVLDASKNILVKGSLTIPIGDVGVLKITNNFTGASASFNGTYTLTQLPVQASTQGCFVELIPSWNNGYAINMYYTGYPKSTGSNPFQLIWLETSGPIGSTSNYANGILTQWGYGVPGEGPGTSSATYQGAGSYNVSSVNDKNGVTTVTYSFNFSYASGTSSGIGTFIYPDASVTTYHNPSALLPKLLSGRN
jgi:hypothetical protein